MIGLYGGTFDPIHIGHLRPALEVCDYLQLESVRFIPAYSPQLKQAPGISAEQRAEIVSLAIEEYDLFDLDRRELQRKGSSYTIDTLIDIRNEVGPVEKLVLLVGSDAFAKLPMWHRWEALLDHCHIAVMKRPGYNLDFNRFPADWWQSRQAKHPSDIDSPAGNVIVCATTALEISSTCIRNALKKGQSVRYLVPQTVAQYLEDNQLYE